MNVLCMGMPFGTVHTPVALYRSQCGHVLRTLAVAGTEEVILDTSGTPPVTDPDYTFEPDETAEAVVARIAREWPPDLLLCWQPEMLPPPLAVEHCPIKTVALVSDWNVYYGQIEHNLARYDVVLTDKLGSRALRLRGATPQYFFPLYSHRTSVHRTLDIERDIDVAFVGNLNHAVHVERGRCLERLAGLSDRYQVVVRCGVYGDEYAHVLNRARIVVNYALRREMNLRCFEALGCGALLFVEADNLEVPDWLKDRAEVVLYRPDDLVTLIEHYLGHPEEAARIARQGHERVAALAGENRFDVLLNWLAEQPMGNRTFCDLPEAGRAFADVMQYSSSLIPGQRALSTAMLERYAREFPDRPEFLAAAASDQLARAAALGDAERKTAVKEVLARFRRACACGPDNVAWWFNLAFVCRRAKAAAAEARCLELALDAAHIVWGSLLLGHFIDPYYAAWRRALAVGEERVEMIWAAAAARLAEIRLEQGQYEEARALARESLQWVSGVAIPYRVWAAAEHGLGRLEEAARIWAEGLAFTAFDADYRLQLIRAWQAIGHHEDARTLAAQSARLFAAYSGAESIAAMFQEMSLATGSGPG